MKIHRTTETADKVLRHIEKLVRAKAEPDLDQQELTLYPYVNGRERGWTLVRVAPGERGYDEARAVSFAENRNSDAVVIYRWKRGDFFKEADNSTINDAAYANKTYFGSIADSPARFKNRFEDAAREIVTLLFAGKVGATR